jgi:hypothetical protein
MATPMNFASSGTKNIKVDKRFNKMLKDKSFLTTGQKDKLGMSDIFYFLLILCLDQIYEFEEPEDKPTKILDKDGNFVWNEESSESSEESQHSEKDVEVEDEEEGFWSDQEEVKYGEEESSRLAVQNLDWDHVGAQDLFFLFSSFCKGEMMVSKVEIHMSEFGKERMEHDSLYGPPKAIFSNDDVSSNKKKILIKKKEKKLEKRILDNKIKALEDEENYEFNDMELRKYEALKMKYYYGVVYCDSPHTASYLYKEIDGMEFEQSNLKIDLRFIPDSIEKFPYEPKEA